MIGSRWGGFQFSDKRGAAPEAKARVADAVTAALWNAVTAAKHRGINTCRNILVNDSINQDRCRRMEGS